jgi:hypothetical protein
MVLRVISGWETMGKKSKLMARANLRHGQHSGSAMVDAMKGDFPDVVWYIVQANR